ncbi:hypothetical protein J6590_057362 [Homalodisca vitripennis]|nr:hypothetical protein J6590_057362 [Homalodisca vitripennis]
MQNKWRSKFKMKTRGRINKKAGQLKYPSGMASAYQPTAKATIDPRVAIKPSLTHNLGTNGFRTTTNGRAGGLFARIGSPSGHPSKQQLLMPRKKESTRNPGKQTRVLRRTLAIAGGAQHQISPPCLCLVMPRKNESTRIPGKQTRVLRRTLAIAGGAQHQISPPCLCSVMPRKNESTRIPGKQTRVLRRTLAIAGEHNIKYLHRVCAQLCQERMSQLVFQGSTTSNISTVSVLSYAKKE